VKVVPPFVASYATGDSATIPTRSFALATTGKRLASASTIGRESGWHAIVKSQASATESAALMRNIIDESYEF
jgi:hypothetical protein